MLFLGASKTFLQELGKAGGDCEQQPQRCDRENGVCVPHLMALEDISKRAVPNTRSWGLNQALRLPAGVCDSSPLAPPASRSGTEASSESFSHGSPGPRFKIMIIKIHNNSSSSSSNNYMYLCIKC